MKEKKTVYYQDEYNDDFAGNNIQTKSLSNDYKYINNSWLFKTNSFLLKYLFAVPVLWLANTLFFRPKIKNKKILKGLKKQGYYIYSNHVLHMIQLFYQLKHKQERIPSLSQDQIYFLLIQ